MKIAIIGGTGIDEMPGFSSGIASVITTRFGCAKILSCKADGKEIIFLPRHGLSHGVAPCNINHRAQIAALKSIGVDRVIGVNAVGSLTADLQPGSFVVLGDFIDLTKQRSATFFNEAEGQVVHTDFCQPYCADVSDTLKRSCKEEQVKCLSDAVYIGVDGPRYETPAEIRLYASWGAHVIGMTNVPEVILAREAGLCYGAISVVTNLAAGLCPTPLNHDEVRSAMASAGEHLNNILNMTIDKMPETQHCTCASNDKLIL